METTVIPIFIGRYLQNNRLKMFHLNTMCQNNKSSLSIIKGKCRGFKTSRRLPEFHWLLDYMCTVTLVIAIRSRHDQLTTFDSMDRTLKCYHSLESC